MTEFRDLSMLSDADKNYVKFVWDDFTYVDGMTLKDVFCYGVCVGRGLVVDIGEEIED